jgi:hypothetical protein
MNHFQVLEQFPIPTFVKAYLSVCTHVEEGREACSLPNSKKHCDVQLCGVLEKTESTVPSWSVHGQSRKCSTRDARGAAGCPTRA